MIESAWGDRLLTSTYQGPAGDGARVQRRSRVMTGRIVFALTSLVTAALVFTATASASCLLVTPAEQRARAHVIFDGVALEGATSTGVQRFRVTRYRKGHGPGIVRVNTGTIRRADGTGSTTSVSIFVKRGDLWRIFARGSANKVLQTNLCDGSRRR